MAPHLQPGATYTAFARLMRVFFAVPSDEALLSFACLYRTNQDMDLQTVGRRVASPTSTYRASHRHSPPT